MVREWTDSCVSVTWSSPWWGGSLLCGEAPAAGLAAWTGERGPATSRRSGVYEQTSGVKWMAYSTWLPWGQFDKWVLFEDVGCQGDHLKQCAPPGWELRAPVTPLGAGVVRGRGHSQTQKDWVIWRGLPGGPGSFSEVLVPLAWRWCHREGQGNEYPGLTPHPSFSC